MLRLIDADKSTEILKRLLYETAFNNSGEASMMCEDIAEHRLQTWIDLVPTEAEPTRHGRWVKPNPKGIVTYDEHAYAECSLCHQAEYLGYGMAYCPHCGAKMDEEAEE